MTRDVLQATPILKDCETSFLETLSEHAHEIQCAKGKILFIHEDPASHFYIIKSGWVKLFRETLDGTQSVIDILPSQNMFGETALFHGRIYPYSAEAVEPSRIWSFPIALLDDEIHRNHALSLNMLSSIAQNRRQQDQEIEHRTLQNAPQRIGCFLLRLVNQNGDDAVTLHLPYDKNLVAARLGMQPETFSRALAKLKSVTDIRIKGATIEIGSVKQLAAYVCSACSSEFPCRDLNRQDAVLTSSAASP